MTSRLIEEKSVICFFLEISSDDINMISGGGIHFNAWYRKTVYPEYSRPIFQIPRLLNRVLVQKLKTPFKGYFPRKND